MRNAEGREVWSFPADGPWSATPLANGNALIVDRQGVREVTRRGDAVASFSKAELQNWGVTSLQLASRLSNGNTIINSWFNEWSGTVDKTKPPVQAIEVTQDKQVVWTLRSWENPDLGPATTIQILDNPEKPEAVSFGGFK